MPKIIMHDGTTKQVSYSKAVEIRAYLTDDVPGHHIDDIEEPDKRQKVMEFMENVANVDLSDLPRSQHTPRNASGQSQAVKDVLADPNLHGYERFKALREAYRSGTKPKED